MSTDRFARQVSFFGAKGQDRLRGLRVAIVGLGGTGSHVVQQLVYLGIRNFVLIDHDTVEGTNLNRLIGAIYSDVAARRLKIDVAERVILGIEPAAIVHKFSAGLFDEASFIAIQSADVVFSCVDRELPRFVLNELCQAFEIPLIDIGTEINAENPQDFGGRVVISIDGERCVVCAGAIDQAELRREQLSEGQRTEEASIYGVERGQLLGPGPSVVTLNGLLASTAVTEFLVHWTGLRTARRQLEYRGVFGVLVAVVTPPISECPYCKNPELRGKRELADAVRWIRQGGGHLRS